VNPSARPTDLSSPSPARPASSGSVCCANCPSAATGCACCCAAQRGADGRGERRGRRPRAAAEHGGGAGRRRRGDPFRRLAHAMSGLPEDDYRMLKHRGDDRPGARGAARRRQGASCFLSSIRAQSGPTSDQVLTEALPRSRPRPMAAPSSRPSRACRARARLGSRCGWCWCMGAGVKGNMAAAPALRPHALSVAARRAPGAAARCSRSTILVTRSMRCSPRHSR
jgi:hypothetical protein